MDKKSIDYSLYFVTPESLSWLELETLLTKIIYSGVSLIQLRDKNISVRDFITRAKRVKNILYHTGIYLIINDRVDIALACGADGVHVGQSDMDYQDVRRIMGPNALIGLSVSTIEQTIQAEKTCVDYLGVGHVYDSSTKEKVYPALEIDGLKKIRALSSKKIVGIGGINHDNACQVVNTGIEGIAVVSAIYRQHDPGIAAKNLRAIVDRVKLGTAKR